MQLAQQAHINERQLFRTGFILAVFTVIYTIAEGLVSVYFGYQDESLTLFGFGTDSFIEVMSGLGIVVMIWRVWRHPGSHRGRFERLALLVTGTAFYILVAGIVITAGYDAIKGHEPRAAWSGIVISLISIIITGSLMVGKLRVGRLLQSDAIIADAHCSRMCIYMSLVVLAASGLYQLTHLPYIDTVGSLGLAWLSYSEGRECFEKARSNKLCGCGEH